MPGSQASEAKNWGTRIDRAKRGMGTLDLVHGVGKYLGRLIDTD